jgi:formylglycine-generating enzyme required for sulfatase activity
MDFLPVPGLTVLFGRCEVSNGQFRRYRPGYHEGQISSEALADAVPVVWLTWHEAKGFCEWLTHTDRKAGLIGSRDFYRLPLDWEWSVAVGLDESRDGSPKDKDEKMPGIYPWGTCWPPPPGAGNFADEARRLQSYPMFEFFFIEEYVDGFALSAPIGTSETNRLGLCEMGGNATEWCEDFYDGNGGDKVMRGASCGRHLAQELQSSFRYPAAAEDRDVFAGFRCVLVFADQEQPGTTAPPSPTKDAPPTGRP